MSDPYLLTQVGRTSPGVQHAAITPNDGADIPTIPRVLRIGGAGTIALRDRTGVDVTYTVTDGEVLLFSPARVLATGTTATGIVGWW